MITGYIVGIIIVLIFIVDVVLYVKKGPRHTISAWIIRHSKKHAVFPFIIGFIMGHLFWTMNFFDYELPENIVEMCQTYIKESSK